LPSVRTLARQLRLSVITTRRAYDELEQAGLIYTRAGVGSFVAEADDQQMDRVRRERVRALVAEALTAGLQLGLTPAQLRALVDEELSRM
jgi:GntR family transcriptional regulator